MTDPIEDPHEQRARVAHLARTAGNDAILREVRAGLATLSSDVFKETGQQLELFGHIMGSDRKLGASPFGHGSDESMGVALVLRIGGELVGSAIFLFQNGQTYAAAALLRQLVEVEYLAWAFETRDREAERWLRSDKKQRELFFAPRKLRAAAGNKFRSQDYGYHCELGGHPVPGARMLLDDQGVIAQLIIADLLGHTGRFWDHFAGWATKAEHGELLLARNAEMVERYTIWKRRDPLAHLPPPP